MYHSFIPLFHFYSISLTASTRHTQHAEIDIQQAAEEHKIAERKMQVEKTTELLRKSREKIAAARNKALTTVEELIRVLKEHEISMVTKLDILEEAEQRRHAIQQEHF